MKRKFRLTRTTDFKRVRQNGKSYAHPLLVLIALPAEPGLIVPCHTRFAVAAGRSVGGAVQRNRAKRLMREAIQPLLSTIVPGWDVIILARRPMETARLQEVQNALAALLQRARLIQAINERNSS